MVSSVQIASLKKDHPSGLIQSPCLEVNVNIWPSSSMVVGLRLQGQLLYEVQ